MTPAGLGIFRNRRRFAGLAACALFVCAAALLPGCADGRHIVAALGSSSQPYQEFLEDPVALTAIKTIAVFPFANHAPQPGFDADVFANQLANQLASQGKVRVIYPREILDKVEKNNRAARRHNAELRERVMLGLYVPEHMRPDAEKADIFTAGDGEMRPRQYQNPVGNVDEAVRLARQAKADAIIVGEITDYDPYMRPRLALTMRLIATGNSETAAQAIAEMTQWGVPRTTAAARGTIYIRQETFDSSVGSVGLEVSKHGRTHIIDNHALGTEVFIRSMSHYYAVVAGRLARSYVDARKKAVKEAEDRAKLEARKRNQDQEAAIRRVQALMERDGRIPDYETDARGEDYFDQAFLDRRALIDANGGDRRIQSWRPDGRTIRPATPAERRARDAAIPENERGLGLLGYSTMVDSAFPDADAMMEMNMGDNRDRSWRPDHFNRANPRKSAPLYAPGESGGGQ